MRCRRIQSGMLNILPKLLKLRFGLSFASFEMKTQQSTRQGRVREIGTCIRPPKSSDRVAAGQTQAGWAGPRAIWTPLIVSPHILLIAGVLGIPLGKIKRIQFYGLPYDFYFLLAIPNDLTMAFAEFKMHVSKFLFLL